MPGYWRFSSPPPGTVETPPPAASRILQETGYIGDVGDENGGWIRFAQSPMRFRLPANPGQVDMLLRLITAASERGVAIRIRYYRMSGRPDAEGDYVEYALCAISVGNGASYGDEAVNCPARSAPLPDWTW